jgi:hypothetical protein
MAEKFRHKPAAPSVHGTVGPAIRRSRDLRDFLGERPISKRELVEDILSKVKLPPSVEQALRENAKKD